MRSTNVIIASLLISQTYSFINRPKHVFIPATTLQLTSEDVMEITMDCEDRMAKTIESTKKNLISIRTGRANPSMLDRIEAEYYGETTPLNQMASVTVSSAQQLTVQPWDKSALKDIEKAIMESDLGIVPQSDGSVIRLNIPALTEERRKDMLKQCKAMGEEGKVAVRNIRRDGVNKIKKMEKDIGKDEVADGEDELQKLTDKTVKEIDIVIAAKEKEVMTV